jgi:hypothetical protein
LAQHLVVSLRLTGTSPFIFEASPLGGAAADVMKTWRELVKLSRSLFCVGFFFILAIR